MAKFTAASAEQRSTKCTSCSGPRHWKEHHGMVLQNRSGTNVISPKTGQPVGKPNSPSTPADADKAADAATLATAAGGKKGKEGKVKVNVKEKVKTRIKIKREASNDNKNKMP